MSGSRRLTPRMDEYKAANGATLRLIDGEYRLGFYEGEQWVDLGPAVLNMTWEHEETGAYTIEWVLAEEGLSERS